MKGKASEIHIIIPTAALMSSLRDPLSPHPFQNVMSLTIVKLVIFYQFCHLIHMIKYKEVQKSFIF